MDFNQDSPPRYADPYLLLVFRRVRRYRRGSYERCRTALRGTTSVLAAKPLPTLLLQIGVVLALVAGTTAFVSLDKAVTVSVDGQEHKVRSFARTVGDLLDSDGIRYDTAHDLVTPEPGAALRDGETVQVRYGRPVLLTLDGETRTVWTTGRTVLRGVDDARGAVRRRLPLGLAQQADRPRRHQPSTSGCRTTSPSSPTGARTR